MKTFNITQLAKGMSMPDKARILIADVEEQIRTDGVGILTAFERDAIIEDASKRHELREVNRIYDLYRTEYFISMDVYSRLQTLIIHMDVVEKIMLAAYLAGLGKDVIDKILHDFAPDENREKLYEKYDFDIKFIDTHSLIVDGKLQPKFPKTFMDMVKLVLVLRGYMYEMEYVQTKTEVQIIRDKDQETLDDCTKLINTIVELEQTLRPVRIFRDYDLVENMNDEEQAFIHTVQDMEKALELPEEEKEKRRLKVDSYLNK